MSHILHRLSILLFLMMANEECLGWFGQKKQFEDIGYYITEPWKICHITSQVCSWDSIWRLILKVGVGAASNQVESKEGAITPLRFI